jgi:hypothetical protein
MEIMPAYTPTGSGTTGVLSYQRCEMGICGDHVPEGGGGVHIHADPFGTNCLYDQNDYVNSAGAQDNTTHPPLLGFSRDGAGIYGRYLSTSAPGYGTLIDSCGGHSHSDGTSPS